MLLEDPLEGIIYMLLDRIASDFGISVVATVLPGAVSGLGERIEFLNFLPPLKHRLRSPYLSFHIMTISSIHHRKVDGLIASAAPVCSNCLRAEDCNLSVDAGSTAHAVTPSTWHAMPWFALARHCSPLLILLVVTIQASWPRQGLLAANITQLGDTGHCSLAKKTELLSELKVGVHVLHSAPTVLVIIIPHTHWDAQAHLDYGLCRSAQSGPCGRSLSVAQQLVLETPTRTILPQQVFPSTAHVLSDLPDCILHLSPTNHVPV